MTKTKKQIIFEEAARLFREKGYPAASMRELAKRVGLKPSSFYSHIQSKEEILQKICFDNAARFIKGMEEVEQIEAGPLEQIKMLIRMHLRIATEDSTSTTVFNDEWRHLSEPHFSEFLQLRKDYERRFRHIIREGVSAGEFKDINPTIVLNSLLTSIRWVHDWYKYERNLSPELIEQDLLRLLLTGLQENKS